MQKEQLVLEEKMPWLISLTMHLFPRVRGRMCLPPLNLDESVGGGGVDDGRKTRELTFVLPSRTKSSRPPSPHLKFLEEEISPSPEIHHRTEREKENRTLCPELWSQLFTHLHGTCKYFYGVRFGA
jgi:hypothetical protein